MINRGFCLKTLDKNGVELFIGDQIIYRHPYKKQGLDVPDKDGVFLGYRKNGKVGIKTSYKGSIQYKSVLASSLIKMEAKKNA